MVRITHANAMQKAEQVLNILKKNLPDAIFEIHPLSPAFITQ